MLPDLLDPLFRCSSAERNGPGTHHEMGLKAQTPAPNGVQGIGLRLEDLTAPVPGGTIGGETRRVYIERPAHVNRRDAMTHIRSASGTRSITGAPLLRKAGGLSPISVPYLKDGGNSPPGSQHPGTDLITTAGESVFPGGGWRQVPNSHPLAPSPFPSPPPS